MKGIAKKDDDGRTVKDDKGETVMVPWTELAADIAGVTGQSAADVEKIVADALAADADSQYAVVKKSVSTEEYRTLAGLKLPFLSFPPHPSRIYPDGAVAGNLIGFVGSDGTPLEGLEGLQNSCLAAEDGSLTYQRGADGVIIPGTEVEKPAVDGGTLKLTIDSDLQWFMQQLISEETARYQADWGGIIVMEAKTGKIRALAETNSVDPNDPGASSPDDRGSRLLRVAYEPGSTFKPVTAATAIEQAGLTPTSTVVTPDRIEFPNGAVINDSESHPTENLTLTGGLVQSSNVAMSQFGTRWRRGASGLPPALRRRRRRRPRLVGCTAGRILRRREGLGQPDLLHHDVRPGLHRHPDQVTSVFQTIANGGVRTRPARRACTKADAPRDPRPSRPGAGHQAGDRGRGVAELENVYAQGTLAADINIPGYRLGVKTGTAQVPDGHGGYKDNLYMTSLAGYAPAEDPQYVVLTLFNEPKTNTMSSANRSVFKKAMTQVLTHYRVVPLDPPPPRCCRSPSDALRVRKHSL